MELGSQPEFHMPNQYENEANLEAHVRTTGPEIWRQTEGKVTHFVAGLGTCGTITGNGRFLKAKNPGVQVIGVHPEEGHDIPGVRSLKQLELTKLFVPQEYDAVVEVSDREAFDMCLRLNREESIIAGPSSAMALVGALKVIEDQPDAVVVIIFPDNSFKYASTFERHFPEVRAARPGGDSTGEPSPKEQLFSTLVENSRNRITPAKSTICAPPSRATSRRSCSTCARQTSTPNSTSRGRGTSPSLSWAIASRRVAGAARPPDRHGVQPWATCRFRACSFCNRSATATFAA